MATCERSTWSCSLTPGTGERSLKKDVRTEFTDKFVRLMEIDPDLHAPPLLLVSWTIVAVPLCAGASESEVHDVRQRWETGPRAVDLHV